MDILCVCSATGGYLQINRHDLSAHCLSKLFGEPVNQIEIWLTELELNGVFSRNRNGTIYSRRMIRAEKNRKNGKDGGNPKLLKSKETPDSVNHPPEDNLIPVPIESIKKEDKSSFSISSKDARARDAHYSLPDNWEPNSDHLLLADQLGYFPDRVAAEAAAMRDWAKAEAKTKANWDAFFSKWLRDPRAKPNGGASGYQRPETLVEKGRRRIAELRRSESDRDGSNSGSDDPNWPILKLVEGR